MNTPAPSVLALRQSLEAYYGGPLSNAVQAAFTLAYEGHEGQFRAHRATDERKPYIVHPVGAAGLALEHLPVVPSLPDDRDTVVCVALAHDLLEDTSVSPARLEAVCGPRVRAYVEVLTKSETGADPPGRRAPAYTAGIVAAGRTAVFVKLCDSAQNLSHPGLTPPDLLRRLLAKAQRHYLPLLAACPLGAAFEATYRGILERAGEHLQRGRAD